MEQSQYVTIVFTVPEAQADAMREVMVQAGAGRVGDYSHCSFSVKGIARYLPHKGAHPSVGNPGALIEVVEERIETICERSILGHVIAAIKKAHPYEETVIDIYPIYEIARKTAR